MYISNTNTPYLNFGSEASVQTKPTVSTDQTDQTSSERLLEAINDARQDHGLNELTVDPALNEASRKNNEENERTGVLDHHNGLINGSGGEITYGGPSETDADVNAAVEAWLGSPGHRDIMLDPAYTRLGADVTKGYATANFA